MTEEYEYECPMCEEPLPADATACPGCGLEFEPDTGLEGSPQEEPPASGDASGDEDLAEVETTPRVLTEMLVGEEDGEGASEEGPRPHAPREAPRKGPHGGVIGVVGLAFLALAVLAVVGTVVLMNWDVWVQGASEESVGDRQRLYIYLGVVGVVVCAVVSLLDILKRRK